MIGFGSLLSLLLFFFSFAPSHATDLSDRRQHPFSFTIAGRGGSHKRQFTIVTAVTLHARTLQSAAVAIRARQCKPMTDRLTASPSRFASPCLATPHLHPLSTQVVIFVILVYSLLSLRSLRAGQVCTRKRNGLHSRPTARLYLLQRADYTCKKSCGKRRAQIPRYRLITEGVVTTRESPPEHRSVSFEQSKFSKC